ncbi:uncharacterized protein PADG_03188 [Paracoccidioides brasiliensis Pb18]|uniref:G-protein coupled receptors family 1 profile domain-containing protein n=2 Tax=Paracoccidioides brasiliensis TaxID=121759 RepID=C1G7N3_PARBD|nr:uncharacterized protein PADG_03188 [Paracoccidioides brasiliensis Pb18]EEH47090.1 hypothetical protein PADG_03188 [Paracoccidioides brasiliensis Pb18]ODH37372.1 hypothetical protein ACO22_02647 [Paracoccidioides brasiliensis]ODH51521.1 hypothetical protein GX48_02389 [Paracoccidioides brasiliensis]
MALVGYLLSTSVQLMPRDESPQRPFVGGARKGLIVLFTCALVSAIATFSTLVWLTYRFIFWKRYYTRYPGYNQCIVLIFNLLLADMQQAGSFLIAPYWLSLDAMPARTTACFFQGWLTTIGDISSGLFILAIALHTFTVVITRKHLEHRTFVACVIVLWTFCVTLAIAGAAVRGQNVFRPGGGWCWIDSLYEKERLYLHYLWVFIAEFGVVLVYAAIFIIVRRRINKSKEFRGTKNPTRQRFNRVLRIMIMYPIAYVVLSLPIAAGLMAMMRGLNAGSTYFHIAGGMMMCSGWVDAILYFFTRRRLVETDLQTVAGTTSSQRRTTGYANAPSTIGGGRGKWVKENTTVKQDTNAIRNARSRQSTSSSTDHIIDPVELADLGQVNQTTVIEISNEPSAVPSSVSHNQSMEFMISGAPSRKKSTSGPPNNTESWRTKYLSRWNS